MQTRSVEESRGRVLRAVDAYHKAITRGDPAGLAVAVKARLWRSDLTGPGYLLGATDELLDRLQTCVTQRPIWHRDGALQTLEELEVLWTDPGLNHAID